MTEHKLFSGIRRAALTCAVSILTLCGGIPSFADENASNDADFNTSIPEKKIKKKKKKAGKADNKGTHKIDIFSDKDIFNAPDAFEGEWITSYGDEEEDGKELLW
jgi:hypothetical protein